MGDVSLLTLPITLLPGIGRTRATGSQTHLRKIGSKKTAFVDESASNNSKPKSRLVRNNPCQPTASLTINNGSILGGTVLGELR